MRPSEVYLYREEPISLEEWVALIKDAPGWELPATLHGRTLDGEDVSIPLKGFAWWHGHSNGEPVPFDFVDGEVRLTDPDEETLREARKLAELLNAQVLGEDGEAV